MEGFMHGCPVTVCLYIIKTYAALLADDGMCFDRKTNDRI